MKISGKFILKVAGTLTAISLVVAALLGFVNSITKDKIAAIEAEKTRVAMSAVVPEGSEFTDKLEIPQAAIDAAKAQGKDYKIWAIEQGEIQNELGNFDVLLLGPQVRHILRRVTKLVGDRAVVDVIDGPSYGRCDGAAVLKQAEELYAGK